MISVKQWKNNMITKAIITFICLILLLCIFFGVIPMLKDIKEGIRRYKEFDKSVDELKEAIKSVETLLKNELYGKR